VEPLISHSDVTTIMALLGDIQRDVFRIRRVSEDEDGEEEASEDDG
jgi:phage host-nuclease inhibitor protein Gam